jgi:hypothetical protein
MIQRFIGDIHGNFDNYKKIIENCENSIQVGDHGVGFGPLPDDISISHKFIRGNHDDPEACKSEPRWIPDGTFFNYIETMLIGGAWSIDKNYRTPYRDWWPEEELSYSELSSLVEKYIIVKPRIMITHDCPYTVMQQFFNYQNSFNSRTQMAFDSMFANHRPKLWIFGHHHVNKHMNIMGTDFLCLGEFSYIDIDLSKL